MDKIIKRPTDIIINDENLTLLPQKAIYYRREKALIVADIHLGKAGHFRSAGLPVPVELAFVDLEALNDLLNNSDFVIEKLIVLGDLFHAKLNYDRKIFEEWRVQNNELEVLLIKGNHDILTDSIYESLNIKVYEIMILNNFLLIHNFEDEDEIGELYKLCGHIHPAVRIHGKAKQSMTLPCFYFNDRIGILPAFGRFTGKHIIKPDENDIVFVITGER